MREKREPLIVEGLEITDAGSEGKAVAKRDGFVYFIEGGVPGDIADIQILFKKKSFAEGKVKVLHKKSEKRVEPFCEHFGVCGGCKWQNMSYESQLHYKHKQVFDALTRLAKIELPEFEPIKPSLKTQYYRNKLEYTFSNKRWFTDEERDIEGKEERALGFHIPKRFDKILDIKHCYLQPDPSNAIRLFVKQHALNHGLTFFDLKDQNGYLRNLIIRTTSTGETMVVLAFYYEDEGARTQLLEALKKQFPEITSLQYVINPKRNDTISDLEVKLYHGRDYILEKMENLNFKIGPKSFYQTNSEQAYELYKITRDFAGLQAHEIVYDLYTGTGTIANFVAHQCAQVIGVEYVPEAIIDAKENSKCNNISNTRFFAGDMKDVLTADFIRENGKPDVIITDPPRAGMHEDVVKRILEAGPSRIVYVSCNPATQARDLDFLKEKYIVTRVQPVDMFPQTTHVENVVLLVRK